MAGINKLFFIPIIILLFIGCPTNQDDWEYIPDLHAHFILESYQCGFAPYGCCQITGKVKNDGDITGYNVSIEFTAYDDTNTIIDTAIGFPANLGDIPAGISAEFEAVFFSTYKWSEIDHWTYDIDWLD